MHLVPIPLFTFLIEIHLKKVLMIIFNGACGMVGSLEIGEDIHAELRNKRLLQSDIVLGNALMDMYFKCGAVEKGQEVFKQLPYQNIVSWSTLMAGYVQNGLAYEALESFRQMKKIQESILM